MDKRDKDLADFEKTFGRFKSHPGYNELFADFVKMQKEHPDGQKPSDLPIAKEFPEINWDGNEEIGIFLKGVLKNQEKIIAKYKQALDAGGKEYSDFVWGIIQDLSKYTVIAHFLQIKVSLTKYLKDEANKEHVLH